LIDFSNLIELRNLDVNISDLDVSGKVGITDTLFGVVYYFPKS